MAALPKEAWDYPAIFYIQPAMTLMSDSDASLDPVSPIKFAISAPLEHASMFYRYTSEHSRRR